jgi:hypothetical protein
MSAESVSTDRMKLVEQCSGIGQLAYEDRVFPGVEYAIRRYQGMALSGLPVPGVHRIDGKLDMASLPSSLQLVGRNVTLRLEDGRSLRISLADESGRVLMEGHGPSRCSCC